MPGEICDDRQIIRVSGADHTEFLQGMISNDVAKLDAGLVYAALLTPQGKYLADFFLVPEDDAILLDVKADVAAGLIQRLSMYKLRADVKIEPVEITVSRGIPNKPAGGYTDPREKSLGWRAYGNAPITSAEPVDWDALRVAACVPETGVELIANDSYLLESGFERLNGVDFKKGCYVGQEVTARMKHKTELRKGLTRVRVTGAATVGTKILSNDKPVGTLFTQSGGQGIAFLRFDRASKDMVAGDAQVHWPI